MLVWVLELVPVLVLALQRRQVGAERSILRLDRDYPTQVRISSSSNLNLLLAFLLTDDWLFIG